MNKIKLYFQESYTELVKKVSWPSWSQLQSSAIVVMIASAIFAVVIFAMDFAFRNIMTFIYNLLY
ncbi:MAG: preprotein translocase subunit SecE [Bacteroidales bacterium]|nr:preprotein translocase subunit SecE [Bacteroidales bacterium]